MIHGANVYLRRVGNTLTVAAGIGVVMTFQQNWAAIKIGDGLYTEVHTYETLKGSMLGKFHVPGECIFSILDVEKSQYQIPSPSCPSISCARLMSNVALYGKTVSVVSNTLCARTVQTSWGRKKGCALHYVTYFHLPNVTRYPIAVYHGRVDRSTSSSALRFNVEIMNSMISVVMTLVVTIIRYRSYFDFNSLDGFANGDSFSHQRKSTRRSRHLARDERNGRFQKRSNSRSVER